MADAIDNCPTTPNPDQNDMNADRSGDLCDCYPINPCLNNGECIAGFQSFSCFCTLGFTGSFCNVNIDECEALSCANGSTCVDMIGMARCDCPVDVWGFACLLTSQLEATIVESSTSGSFVYQVTPNDFDDFSTFVLHHEIVLGNKNRLFQIDMYSGNITTASVIDREESDVHLLTVKVTEPRNDPPLVGRSTIAHVTVFVDDVNDNAPVFVRNVWNANVQDEDDSGAYVARVTATDKDTGMNANLVYSLVAGRGVNFFEIDAVTGIVTLHEQISWSSLFGNVTLLINVTDLGQPPMASESLAFLHICPPGYSGDGCKESIAYR